MTAEPAINTLLPQSAEAEFALVACLLIDTASIGPLCAERGITTAHFHLARYAIVFDVLYRGWLDGKTFDAITLTQRLKDDGNLEACGGHFAISELATFPTSGVAGDYAEICEEKRILRNIWRLCNEYGTRALTERPDPRQLLEDVTTKLCAVTAVTSVTVKPKTPKELAFDAIDRAQDRISKRGLPDNVMRTGLKQLDDAMSGIRGGDFVLVSGKEKSGKTSLAFNILEHVVFEQKKRALAVSLEMKVPEITDRMIASMGRINFTNILNGWMTEGESTDFARMAEKLSTGKFQIRDDIFSLPQIVGALRQHKGANPDLELVIVDYLQLVDADKVGKDDSREQIISKTSRTLRRAANELNIGMLLLVQLNEDGQVRESRAPGMDCTAHIRIEPGDEEGEKWARVVYQRNGPSNVGIPLTHLGQFLRFEQAAPRERKEKEPPRRRRKGQFDD